MSLTKTLLFLLFLSFCNIQAQKIWNILPGDYADPSIVRVGEDYFMTNTSFDYIPGLLIWHSTDLKKWQPINYALHKNVGDTWAPDFVYYKNKFYIYFSTPNTNYVVTADDPAGEWSDPIDLKTNGIHPGHIATPEGKRYLYLNNGWMIQLSEDGLSTIGEKQKKYDGWPIPSDWNVECFCLESPKMNYINGYYYMTSAQGGTAGPSTSHMVISARSETVDGPWENSAFNPVVRTWSPDDIWWSKGHGTLFDDAAGNWHIVYHAYKKNELNMGRQVLIEPIKWTKDGWFRLKRKPTQEPLTHTYKNYILESDDFEDPTFKFQWQFTGIKSLNDVTLSEGSLFIPSANDEIKVLHTNCPVNTFTATVKLSTSDAGLEYGFVLYYNEKNYIGLGMKNDMLYAFDQGLKRNEPLFPIQNFKFFKLIRTQNDLQLAFSKNGTSWQYYPIGKEVSGYNHNMLGDFRNLKIGIICRGTGVLKIDDFTFTPSVSD